MEDLFQVNRFWLSVFRLTGGLLLLSSLPYPSFAAPQKSATAVQPADAGGGNSIGGRDGANAKPKEAKPAELKIAGYGILGNRDLRRVLQVLLVSGTKPEFFDANFIEDAALILLSTLRRDGYLQ